MNATTATTATTDINATTDVKGDTPQTVRVKILSAARLKSMFEGPNGAFNLQNLLNWVRLLVKLLTLPFRMLSSLVSGRPVAPTAGDEVDTGGEVVKTAKPKGDAVVDATIDVAKFANDAKKPAPAADSDPALDAAKFADDPKGTDKDPVQEASAKTVADAAQAPHVAVTPVAANDAKFINELLGKGGDLELEFFGVPSEIKKVQDQILALLEPVLATGHKFNAPNVAEGGEESILRTMGEESERFRYAQKLSAKQIVFFSQQIADKQSETIGMSPETIVNYVDSLRKGNTQGAIKEGSAYHQLAGILEADQRIRTGYDRHISAAAGLIHLYGGEDSDRFNALKKEFEGAALIASTKLQAKEDAILESMTVDKEKYTNVPEKDVLFYTVRTSVKALEKALSEKPKQEEVTKTALTSVNAAEIHSEMTTVEALNASGHTHDLTTENSSAVPASDQNRVSNAASVDRSKLSLSERAKLDAADDMEEFSDHDDEKLVM